MTVVARAFVFCIALLPFGALAQEVGTCDDFRTQASNLAEPWQDNTRLFANGAIRIALMDTLEPAAGAFHLMILSLPADELGLPQCRVVSATGTMGFAFLTLDDLIPGYDPANGLSFDLAGQAFQPDTGDFKDGRLMITG
jgi:hypothetical protein